MKYENHNEVEAFFNHYKKNRFNISSFRINYYELVNYIELSNFFEKKINDIEIKLNPDSEYLAKIILLSYRAMWWNLYIKYSHIPLSKKSSFLLEYEPHDLFNWEPELEQKLRQKYEGCKLRPFIRFVPQSKSFSTIVKSFFKKKVQEKTFDWYLKYLKEHPFILPFKVFILGEAYFFYRGSLIITTTFIPNYSKEFFYNLYAATFTVFTNNPTAPTDLFCFSPSEYLLDPKVERVKLDLPREIVLKYKRLGLYPLIESEDSFYIPFSITTLISPKPYLVDLKNKWCFTLNYVGDTTLRNYWKIPKDKIREYDIHNLNIFNRYFTAPLSKNIVNDINNKI